MVNAVTRQEVTKIGQRELDKVVRTLNFIPIVVLIGIYLAGVFVEELFSFLGATKYLFLGIGGIGFLIYYSHKKMGEL